MKLLMMLLFLFTLNLAAQSEWKVAGKALTASDGESGNYFGYSVDVSEHYAIVGAPSVSMGGAVYIFKKSVTGEWEEVQKLNGIDASISPSSQFDSSDEVTIASFGSAVAIAESVNPDAKPSMLVVGAPGTSVYHDMTNFTTGAACMYELNTTSNLWQQQKKCYLGVLFQVDSLYASAFGSSVDISNWSEGLNTRARMIIGDPMFDAKNSNVGLSLFYVYNSTGWTFVNYAVGYGGATGSNDVYFGGHVAIHKNTSIVGATGVNIVDPNDDDPNSVEIIYDVGAVYFFASSTGDLINSYTPPHEETVGGHKFGMSVDIHGDYAIVGENHREGGYTDAAVYIMKRGADGNWTQHNYIENGSRGYGYSVALNDTHALVTAFNGPAVGAVYAYRKDENGDWNTQEPYYWLDHAKQTAFGIDVALYEDTMLVGAPFEEHVIQFKFVDDAAVNPAIIMYLLN